LGSNPDADISFSSKVILVFHYSLDTRLLFSEFGNKKASIFLPKMEACFIFPSASRLSASMRTLGFAPLGYPRFTLIETMYKYCGILI